MPTVSPVRREAGLLVALMLGAAFVWLFGTILDDVRDGDAHAFDRALLLAFRSAHDLSDPLGPSWVESAARDVTSLGSFVVLLIVSLGVIGFELTLGRVRSAALVAVAVGGGALLSSALKGLLQRPRPDLVPHVVDVHTFSFPSGHAMLSAVTYLTLGALLARLQSGRATRIYALAVALILTFLVGVSRVYLGVHWPTDVLAGWTVGAAWALLCWSVALYLQRRLEIAGDRDA